MSDRQTVVYTAGRPQQAYLFRNLLAEQGISAVILNEALQSAVGEVPFGWSTAARVVMHENDAVEARRLALEFDRSIFGQKPTGLEIIEAPEPEVIVAWPQCPECQRRRTTSCPICKTSGASFEVADQVGHVEEEPADDEADQGAAGSVMLLCNVCDEPFAARYLRRCEWCGHDFGEGTQLPKVVRPAVDLEIGRPAIVLMVGIVAALAAIIGYFAYLIPE